MAQLTISGNTTVERTWASARLLDLFAVIVIAAVVVVFGALWGSERSSTGADGSVVAVTVVNDSAISTPLRASAPAVSAEATSVASNSGSEVAATRQPLRVPPQSGIIPGRPDPAELARPNAVTRHTVQAGKSLDSIARGYGITMASLLRWNWDLSVEGALLAGDTLWIPSWDQAALADEAEIGLSEGKSGHGGG